MLRVMGKIAFMFPGQGAQYVGMGKDFYEEYDFVKEIYEIAEKASDPSTAVIAPPTG